MASIRQPEAFFQRAGHNDAVTELRGRRARRNLPLSEALTGFAPTRERLPDEALISRERREQVIRIIDLLP